MEVDDIKTETMVRELRRLAKIHKDDFVGFGENNWSVMCTDVADRLEELEKSNNVDLTEILNRVSDVRYKFPQVNSEQMDSILSEVNKEIVLSFSK